MLNYFCERLAIVKIKETEKLSENAKLLVQKSYPLLSLWQSKFTLSEFKILDVYLSKINSRDPQTASVTFKKGELEQLMEVDEIRQNVLEERLKHLMSHVVKINDPTVKRGFTLITLFQRAVAEQDNRGLWTITLKCSPDAEKYVFNIENIRYLRYKLKCITCLQSRHSYIMFLYLEANRFRKTWSVDVDELRTILSCTEPTYQQYKRFNDLVLKKIYKELNEKTDCKFEYKPVRTGHFITAIEITLKTVPELSVNDLISDDPFEVLASKLYNFTAEQIAEIRILTQKQADQCYYLKCKLAELMNRNDKTPIKNKFAYLKKMIKNDVQTQAQQHEEQRKTASYDLKAYEEMFNSKAYQDYLFSDKDKENKP